ncbi:MAG: undecaprenyl-phosphate galactose phosphotransferase WbaP [Neisseriaceae bacterium]
MKKSIIQKMSLILSDGIALCVSLILAVYVLNILRPGSQEYIDLNKLGLAKIFGFFILAVFWQQEHYTKRRPTWEEIKLLYLTIFVFAIIHFALTYLLAHHIVKLVNVAFWFFLLFILPFFRYLTKNVLLILNFWQRDIYIVGCGKNARDTYRLLKLNYLLGYKIIGFINIQNKIDIQDINSFEDNIPVYNYNKLLDSDTSNEAEVIFALETQELTENIKQLDIIQTKFTFVSVVPDVLGIPLYGVELDHFFGNEQVILRLKNNLSRRINRIIKRSSDIFLSIMGIILLSPLFILFSILIKLSGNKVFFKHKRIGRNGNYFNCIKFQTMHQNSQEILKQILATDEEARKEWEKDFKLKNDPRITTIGKFLRTTSLDEIPQLFNVLKGDMSIVGPRPIIDAEVVKYNNDFYYYKLVRPGITGLWQISGRNDVDYTNRVRLDVWYVKNWSLWYDFVIIFRTLIVVLSRKGAY